MMQEYDDDFFFEEDRIKNGENNTDSMLLLPVDLVYRPTNSQMPQEGSNNEVAMNISVEIQALTEYNEVKIEQFHQDLLGMTVTSGSVTLSKDEKNLIGVSIGGGAPLCPCLYIVQIFDNTPASRCGILQSGDELVGVNGQSVKGKTKVEVAKMIQSAKDEVIINYNKLHADPEQGKSLDIIMKKIKHRFVENMSAGTANALGLSRAILCNDSLVAKLKELRETEIMYKRLVQCAKRMLKSYFDLLQTYRALGDIFAGIGVREPQTRASEAFTKFGQYHRLLEKGGIKMLKALKPILEDMGTYLNKAIPDTKLTIRKYADTKFEYLSYCLKVKEMDDEEYAYNSIQEPSYRVETGNYEYRLILRCRQEARVRFARLRADVLVKLELLDNKKTQDVAYQLKRFINGLARYHNESSDLVKDNLSLFPVEVDLSQNAFQYKSTAQIIQDIQDEEEFDYGSEIQENYDINDTRSVKQSDKDYDKNGAEEQEQLLPELSDNSEKTVDNLTLLTELGLNDTLTDTEFGDFQNGLMDEFLPQNSNENNDIFDKLLNELNNEK